MEDKKTKKQKPAKTPGAFKKPLSSKVFEKKYLKYIEHPGDKKFFTSCFEKHDDNYVIRNSLTRDDVKKLKGLLKVVKANRKGAVKLIPVLITGAVVAVIIAFFTIFANPLLERALEKGLEAIFEAKSDVRNFRLSVIRFSISIQSITVANRDSPMTNLFEMGRTEIRMKPEAVLRGKIYIEEIHADTIRFGTARTVSGALPEKPPKVKEEKIKSESPPLVDLRNFDAMALLNQEYGKLNTPKLYDAAIEAYNELVVKWEGQVENVTAKAEELRVASTSILNTDVNSIRDAAAITSTIQDINNMVTLVQSTADDASNIVGSIESDINTARQLEQNARDSLINDINYLKSLVDLGSGAAFAALEPVIRDMLSDAAEEYIDYGLRALEVLEKLKSLAEAQSKTEKAVKEPKVTFKGRDVQFPVISYPKFYLGIMTSDFTLDTWNWLFDLRDVSSNPDLTNRPVALKLGVTEEGGILARYANFNGSADFRTNPDERFNAAVNAGGFPVSFTQLNASGINGFSGESEFGVSLTGRPSGAFSGGGDVKINNARLTDPKGTLAEAIDTAIREVNYVNLGFQYLHHIDRSDEFNISTNIAELVAQAVRRIAETYAQKAMDDIEQALRQRISQYIDDRFISKDELDLLFKIARGDKDSVDQLKTALTNKKNEFEQKLRSAADEATQQVKEEATQQVEQAIQNLLPGTSGGLLGR